MTAVDVSQSAIDMAKSNAARNGLLDRMDFLTADVFDLLPRLEEEKQKPYDFIILDPPAFTKSRRTVHSAEKVTLRKMFTIFMRNDQLVPIGIASLLFNIGNGLHDTELNPIL